MQAIHLFMRAVVAGALDVIGCYVDRGDAKVKMRINPGRNRAALRAGRIRPMTHMMNDRYERGAKVLGGRPNHLLEILPMPPQ